MSVITIRCASLATAQTWTEQPSQRTTAVAIHTGLTQQEAMLAIKYALRVNQQRIAWADENTIETEWYEYSTIGEKILSLTIFADERGVVTISGQFKGTISRRNKSIRFHEGEQLYEWQFIEDIVEDIQPKKKVYYANLSGDRRN